MSETQQPILPITALIISRSKELGLSRNELVRRCGYTQHLKGPSSSWTNSVSEISEATRGLLQALPTALEVSPDDVRQAVEDTQRHFRETEEAAYRASFVPHAIILTDRKIPQPDLRRCHRSACIS